MVDWAVVDGILNEKGACGSVCGLVRGDAQQGRVVEVVVMIVEGEESI